MTVRDEIVPTRVELSGSQRALLEERLKRARQTAGKSADRGGTIPRRSGTGEIPLSFAQERLWFLDQLEPGSPVYNVCEAVRMKGTLDVAVLERSLNEIVRRHESLRTNFISSEGGAVQVIAPARTLTLNVVDLSAWRDGSVDQELHRRVHEESRRPFDFTRDLLIRALLVRTAPTEHTLLLTMHHIISDGWSIGVLFRELSVLYSAQGGGNTPALPELPIQFADYAVWERAHLDGPALERSLAYWKQQLAGPLPVIDLPLDHPRPASPSARGALQSVPLSRALTHGLKALAQQEGATLFMTLLAAFNVLLHRWSGQTDIVVGSVVAGRRKVEVEKLIGFFVNTLVFRGDLTGNPTFRELLGRVRDMSLGALAHQDMPFEWLVKELRPDRAASRNPLFQVMFVLQNVPMAPMELPQLTLEPLEVDTGTAKFDLTLSMVETPQGLRAGFEYNTDVFEATTIARLLGCLETLLEAIVAQPDQRIGQLELLTAADRRQFAEWNRTTREFPRHATVHGHFEAQAARAPDALAVVCGGRTLTYRELDARANQLAHRLQRAGVRSDSLVALCLERSPEMIVALVAILKAGATYVSLDPSYPKERLRFMLDDTRAPVLLTQQSLQGVVDTFVNHAPAAQPGSGVEIICLDSGWPAIAAESEQPCAADAGGETIAYVSYTSGSTGRPKGVRVPHRAVLRLLINTDFIALGPQDAVLQIANCAFDASTFEIWGALLHGGRLVILPQEVVLSPSDFAREIAATGITAMFVTTALFNQLSQHVPGALRTVRSVMFGGEAVNPGCVREVLRSGPPERLLHVYGPTETTTFATWFQVREVPEGATTIPIGRPLANTTLHVLDAYGQLAPVGMPGELYIGGDGVASGYLNRPELTAAKFVRNPFAAEPAGGAMEVGDQASAVRAQAEERAESHPAEPTIEDPEPGTPPPAARLYRTGDRVRWLPDGTIEFLGRIDRQVKIRGFRVEPDEVETVLMQHAGVKECAVVVRDDPSGAKCLVAYVVSRAGPASTSADDWRAYLEQKLPDYMVPAAFVPLDALPLNANGKIDTAALPAHDGNRPDLKARYVAPRDEIETQLSEIWETVLGVKPVGMHDRFFDLGGHSLLAVRVIAHVEKKFGRKLPVAAIFQHRTIEQLARLLRDNEPRYASATSVVEIQGHGTNPPLYLVHGVGGGMFWGYANLARHLGIEQPLYAFKSRGLDGLPEWASIEEMAANYVADLRAHQPRGPYLLGGYCFGGIVAYEMARQLQAQGESVRLLGLMNCSPPNTDYDQPDPDRSFRWCLKFVANLAYWIGCFLFSWTFTERLEFVRWKFRILRKKAAGPLQPGAKDDLPTGDVDELVNLAAYSDKQRALWESHVRALIRYQPQPYAGHVTLFRTRGHALRCSFDEQYGWGRLARGGVDVKLMPGGHGNILDEPHVRSVAQALKRCLQEATTRRGGVR